MSPRKDPPIINTGLVAPRRVRPEEEKAVTRRKKTAKRKTTGPRNKPRRSSRTASAFSLGTLFKWVVVAGVWGIIALGIVVAWFATGLPDIMAAPQFERRSSIVVKAQDGTILRRYGELTGVSVTVSDLPPHLIQAVLATEDRRFYKHFGIDPIGIARAMYRNVSAGGYVQGGSTITQQLAKNLFLSQERTLKRKAQEALLALWLEKELTKDEILSAYLNRVYLGSGAYGVDAAAHIYFDKSARDVNLREAAILAGLLKAPSRYSPASNPRLAQERAQVVLAAMYDAGYLTKTEYETQRLDTPLPRRKPSEGESQNYFTDWITAELNNLVGSPGEDLVVDTTLQPRVQELAENAINKILREEGADRNATQGAMIVLSRDGAVLAMVGGRNYETSQFNRATQALRPPGSAFKPIVFLAALQQGWRINDLIDDAPISIGRYSPQNYRHEYMGEVPLYTAMTYSLNAATVRLASFIGIDKTIAMARTLGVEAKLQPDMSLALGSSGVPMLEMAAVYATLANNGQRVTPYAVSKISTDDGTLLYRNFITGPGRTVVDPRHVADLNRMLESVVEYGTGQGAKGPYYAAGKTGTSQDFRDAWFVGFTNDYVAAVWIGNDDNSPMKSVSGGSMPARIWRQVMSGLPQSGGRPDDNLPPYMAMEQGPDGTYQARQDLPVIYHEEKSAPGFAALLKRVFND